MIIFKKPFLLLLNFMIGLLLISCSDPIRDDMKHYVNEVIKLEPAFEAFTNKMDSLNHSDKDVFLAFMKESAIPLFESTKEQLENIDIKTKEVSEVNTSFIEVMELGSKCFMQASDSVEYQDESRFKEAEQTYNAVEAKLKETESKWIALCEQHDVPEKLKRLLSGRVMPKLN